MRRDDVPRLLARYLAAQEEGKDAYFDADEIEQLLDSFEESEDYTLYDGVLSLGMKLHPNHSGLEIKQCKLLIYNELYEQALINIDSIAETNEPELDMLRMECYCSLDKYNEVLTYLDQLIASDCDYLTDIFEYIAPLLGELGMHKEAIEFIHKGQTLFPDNIELKEELCYNLELTGKIDEAIVLCNALIDNNPYSFDDWVTLGRLYSIKGDYEKAIEAFDFALTCDDTDAEIKMLKAYCLSMNENYQKAIEAYNELVIIPEYTYRIKPLLAECYLKLNDFETAYQLLHESITSNKADEEPATYINYLLCCAKTNRLKEEEQTLNKALKAFPNHINLLYIKALYQAGKEEEGEAIKTLQLILSLVDFSEENLVELMDTHFQLGNLLLKKENYTQALTHFLKVANLNPSYPMVNLRIAICYINSDDYKNFIEYISLCSDQEIIDFEMDYLEKHKESDKEETPLIEIIKQYLDNRKQD